MGSLKERMKTLPRIKVECTSEFVAEVQKEGIKIAEVVIFIEEIQLNASTGESTVKINAYTPGTSLKRTITSFEVRTENETS